MSSALRLLVWSLLALLLESVGRKCHPHLTTLGRDAAPEGIAIVVSDHHCCCCCRVLVCLERLGFSVGYSFGSVFISAAPMAFSSARQCDGPIVGCRRPLAAIFAVLHSHTRWQHR